MTSAERQREKQELERRINQMRADLQKKHQDESDRLKKDHDEELQAVRDRATKDRPEPDQEDEQ
jgi:hypothetical protein